MDRHPVIKDDKKIMQYRSTQSMRDVARQLTFFTKQRHHTRWLTKHKQYKLKKQFEKHGFIALGVLEQ